MNAGIAAENASAETLLAMPNSIGLQRLREELRSVNGYRALIVLLTSRDFASLS
jgi:hypothetical protein